jgi:large subunit ribosomal protein L6
MSRVGKHPVEISEGVSVEIKDGKIVVKGKLGELSTANSSLVNVKVEDKHVVVTPKDENDIASRAMWGTMRANIANMVVGVSKGFSKAMEVVGVGYKVALKGNDLSLNLGYSHDITYKNPGHIKFEIVSATEFKVTGVDKVLVGRVADEIKKFRLPEPYKGKGVFYVGQWVRRKEGKKK